MKDPTLERSHTSAKLATNVLLRNKFCKDMKDPTLERSHTIAKLVTSGLVRKEIY